MQFFCLSECAQMAIRIARPSFTSNLVPVSIRQVHSNSTTATTTAYSYYYCYYYYYYYHHHHCLYYYFGLSLSLAGQFLVL